VTDVDAGFFSLTSGPVSGDDDAYLRWHLLDHLPEQYTIPGIRLGTRWRADDSCIARRLAAAPELEAVRHAVCYLVVPPVPATLSAFASLGRELAQAGRYPEPATPHLLGAYRLGHAAASPAARVSAGAVPFRPHRGVYLLVEELALAAPVSLVVSDDAVAGALSTDGVAGAWTFAADADLGIGPDQGARFGMAAWDPGGAIVTLVYLDGDVDATAARLEPWVHARWAGGAVTPRLAGPFRSPTRHDAWPG
jgi:hypothetical protein